MKTGGLLHHVCVFVLALLLLTNLPHVSGQNLIVSGPSERTEQGTVVTIQSGFDEMRSGSGGQFDIQIKYDGGLSGVSDANGKTKYDIFKNSDSSIVGFNFSPATEINQIVLLARDDTGRVTIIPSVADVIFGQVKAAGKTLDDEDKAYFFLEAVDASELRIQYRGAKLGNPPVRPFRFNVTLNSPAVLSVKAQTIK